MPITARKDGIVSYQIEGRSPSVTLASNRQKKVLRLFDVHFVPTISAGAAGWEIAAIMSDEESRLRWRRYLFLTNDYGSETDQLTTHDPKALIDMVIPDDWSSSRAAQLFKDELIAQILYDGSFDRSRQLFLFRCNDHGSAAIPAIAGGAFVIKRIGNGPTNFSRYSQSTAERSFGKLGTGHGSATVPPSAVRFLHGQRVYRAP